MIVTPLATKRLNRVQQNFALSFFGAKRKISVELLNGKSHFIRFKMIVTFLLSTKSQNMLTLKER